MTHEKTPEPEVPPMAKRSPSTLGAWVLLHLAFGLYVVSQFFLTKLGIIWGTAAGQILFLLLPALLFARWKSPSVKAALRLRPVTGAIWWRVTLLALTGVGAAIFGEQLTRPWIARYFADWIPMLEVMAQLLTPKTADGLLSNLVVIGLVAPVCEEVLFRGAFQGSLEQRGPVRAIAWTALVFGVIHLNPFNFIGPILYGVGLGLVVWRTGSILPAILWHALNNSVAVVMMGLGGSDFVPPWWANAGLTLLFGCLLWEFILHTRQVVPTLSSLANAPTVIRGGLLRVFSLAGSACAMLLLAGASCFGRVTFDSERFSPDYAAYDVAFYTRGFLRPLIGIHPNDVVYYLKDVKTQSDYYFARVIRMEGDRVVLGIKNKEGAPFEKIINSSEIIGKLVWKLDPGKEIKELQRQIKARRSGDQPDPKPTGQVQPQTNQP